MTEADRDRRLSCQESNTGAPVSAYCAGTLLVAALFAFSAITSAAVASESYERQIQIEKILQGDAKLTDARERLNALAWLLNSLGLSKSLSSEDAWMSKRDHCREASCLLKVYGDRLSEVRALVDASLDRIDGPVSWRSESESNESKDREPCSSLFFGSWYTDGKQIAGSMEHTGQCGDKVDDRDFSGTVIGKVAFVRLGGQDSSDAGLALLAHGASKVYFKLIRKPETDDWGFWFPDDEIAPETPAVH